MRKSVPLISHLPIGQLSNRFQAEEISFFIAEMLENPSLKSLNAHFCVVWHSVLLLRSFSNMKVFLASLSYSQEDDSLNTLQDLCLPLSKYEKAIKKMIASIYVLPFHRQLFYSQSIIITSNILSDLLFLYIINIFQY